MDKSNLREPVVAGRFYPAISSEVIKQIEKFINKGVTQKKDAIACVLPHAGYVYSGRVAVETVSRIKIRDKVILLGPNHTGAGAPFSIQTKGIWATPLGDLEIDGDLAAEILKGSRYLKEDAFAHSQEHSLEVELPILQYFKKQFKIVPICILSDDPDILKEVGAQIGRVIAGRKEEDSVLIVASSDMTHYEPQALAVKKDASAISAILNFDINKLTEQVRDLDISMCGYAPVCVMLSCAGYLGAKSAELIRYQTSGDVTGDTSSVVGYAGIIVN